MAESVPAGLRIHLLGQPRFHYHGEPYAFRSRPRALVLLTYLLLNRGAHLTRDLVAFVLWPDDSEAEARGKLRRHLHQLTLALPASTVPYILSEEETLCWNDAAGVWVDVDAFERCIGDRSGWAEAIGLYEGDLALPIYDDWIAPLRERYRREYIGTLEQLLFTARSRRDFALAADYAQRILASDQWREDAVRQLASIRYESGDRAGALREIDVFARRLAADMNVDPMAETLALRAVMLRGGALPDAAAQPASGASAPGSIFPFVGREAELERVAGAWRSAAQGHGSVVLVSGEAGIGKTRLANELALLAGTHGGRVLRGTTSSPEQVPYQAIVEALRDALPLLALLDVRPIWLAAVAAIVPELAMRPAALPALPELEPARERSRLLEGLTAIVQGLAQQRPVVLIIQDIQWAGEATLSALEYLARRVAAFPALILATYRDEGSETARAVHALRRTLQLENVAQHVSLGGLSGSDVLELARSVPALGANAEAVGAHVHAVSGGNPLFILELLRESAETGMQEASSHFLRAMIQVRAGRLSDNARRIGEIASVVGTTFDADFLRDVSGLPESVVLDGVSELLGHSLVREVGRVYFAFTFTHHLIAAAIYDQIDPQRRMHWHRRVAATIERFPGGLDDVSGSLAYHYDKAGEPEHAAKHYFASAERNFSVFANEDALARVSRGLELAAEHEQQRALLGLRERILARLGNRDAQRADIEALEKLARDDKDRMDVVWRRAQWARALGELTDEARYLEYFLQRARAGEDPARQAAGQSACARNFMLRSRYADAAEAARAAIAIHRERNDAAGEANALCLLSEIAVNRGEAAQADGFLEQARLRAQSAANPSLIARIAMTSAGLAIMRRDFARALGDAREAQMLYRDIGDREGEAEAGTRVASALSFQMRFEEASAEFAASAEIYHAIGNRLQLAYLLFNQTGSQMQLGLLEDARAALMEALEIFEAFDDTRGRAAALTNLSMVRLLQRAPNDAKAIGLRALQAARAIANSVIEGGALANLGNAERELGDLDAALQHMLEAIALRERMNRPATFEELADLALAQMMAGDASAVNTADEIMQRADASGENTVWPHYCFWAAARVYHSSGDESRATVALLRARELVRLQLEILTDARIQEAFCALPAVKAIASAEGGVWP